ELDSSVELPDSTELFVLTPGRAFWLITRKDHQINTGLVAGLSMATGQAYPIRLDQGWNQIGDPFYFPVAWASVRKPRGVISSSLVGFDPSLDKIGDYDYAHAPPEVLEPFEGYFIFDSVGADTLWVPPIEATAPKSHAVANADREGAAVGGWRLRFRASTK